MTLLAPMLQPQQYRQFKTSSSRSCHIHLTVLTSHHATSMPSVHLKKYYIVAGLGVMKKRKQRCTHGFRNNLKHALPLEPGSLWTNTSSVCVELQGDYVENSRAVMYISLYLWLVIGYCLYFLFTYINTG